VSNAGAVEIITAVTALVAAVGGVIAAWRIGGVRKEVRTWNEQSIGQLAAGEESRRIHEIPYADRTDRESRHLAMDTTPKEDRPHD